MALAGGELTRHGEIVPMFIGLDAKLTSGEPVVIPCQWTDEATKQQMLMAVRLVFALCSVERYLLISECWLAPVDSSSLTPSQRETREEAVQIILVNRHSQALLSAPILRDASGQPSLGPTEWLTNVSGRMFELLPDEPLPPRLWPLARELLGALHDPKSAFH